MAWSHMHDNDILMRGKSGCMADRVYPQGICHDQESWTPQKDKQSEKTWTQGSHWPCMKREATGIACSSIHIGSTFERGWVHDCSLNESHQYSKIDLYLVLNKVLRAMSLDDKVAAHYFWKNRTFHQQKIVPSCTCRHSVLKSGHQPRAEQSTQIRLGYQTISGHHQEIERSSSEGCSPQLYCMRLQC